MSSCQLSKNNFTKNDQLSGATEPFHQQMSSCLVPPINFTQQKLNSRQTPQDNFTIRVMRKAYKWGPNDVTITARDKACFFFFL